MAERLLQGHWSLLVGYGCLPWVALTVLSLRRSESREAVQVPALLFWMALAGLTPTGLMLAATVALTCATAGGAGRSRRFCALLSLGAAVGAALPWLTAAAVAPGWAAQAGVADAGVAAFAARAEPGLGTLGSLAGLGGIWNAEAVPASRTSVFAMLSVIALLTIVAIGVPLLIRRRVATPLLLLALVAVTVPALMATGPGLAIVEAVIRGFPGLGVVRDGQKWVALAMPVYALAAAGTVVTLRPRVPALVSAAVCCAVLVATLPDLAWGVGGQVRSVHYPPGWQRAAALINADPGPVAVLPVDSMRRFPWAGEAPVLDPLPRWVRAEVLSTGDLVIAGRLIPGEGTRAREVQQLLVGGADAQRLAEAGVRWVVVEGPDPGQLPLPLTYRDSDIAVYAVGGNAPQAPQRGVLLGAHLVWLIQLLGSLLALVVGRVRRRTPRAAAGRPATDQRPTDSRPSHRRPEAPD